MIASLSTLPKVSVIVPVYQVERYIERCVRSLMVQSLKDIEYIFVDDCGEDSSMEILIRVLEDYPQRREAVTIIHNAKNLGLSLTRKAGVMVAQGQYVIACDSDDWVERDTYQRLYEKAKETSADIVVCDYLQESEAGEVHWHFALSQDAKECLQRIHDNHQFSWTIWNQLMRRDIAQAAIHQVHPTTYAEDIYTMIHAYWLADKIAHVPEALYHYNMSNVQSVMTRRNWTIEIWPAQRQNIDDIVRLLNPSLRPEYALACQWLKFKIKEKLPHIFASPKTYYRTYQESHKDIMNYGYLPLNVRRKLRLIYSCYPAYWLYHMLKS